MHPIVHFENRSALPAPNIGRAPRIAALAHLALVDELELTPKPGLVDRRGSGAHDDLSFDLMLKSAAVLEPYFASMARIAEMMDLTHSLRRILGAIGRAAERAMFKATGGINSHKGAIWVMGLLVSAAAWTEGQSVGEIAATAGAISRMPDTFGPELVTHGEIVRRSFGVAGAREEAANDFVHVIGVGIPTLRERRAAGCLEGISRLDALMALMAEVKDTCILYRGGSEGLNITQTGARLVLNAGGCGSSAGQEKLRALDRELLARRLSPGGSADLLAATIFLDAVERGNAAINRSRNEWEEPDGAA